MADHDRPLNKRGKGDAPKMGQLIESQGLTPDVIVCSSANRARKTAEKVAEGCGYQGEVVVCDSLYLADPGDCITNLSMIGDTHARVLMVGHNPGLENLVHVLTGHHEAMPTCALAHVELEIETWSELSTMSTGNLKNFWRPREME